MKKRIFAMLLSLVMIACSVPFSASALGLSTSDGTEEPAHEGCLKNDPECTVVLETVKKEATCKQAGNKEFVWACGKLTYETIPVTDEHNWISLKDGEWICKNCGKFTTEDPNPETPAEPAHEGCLKNDSECTVVLETVKQEATCKKEGSKEIVWACGKLVFEAIPVTDEHNWISVKEGEWFCKDCGKFITENPNPEEPAEPAHEGCLKNDPECTILLETVKKEATCTEEGSKEIVWACGKLVFEVLTAPGAHVWEDGVCTACGEKSPFETAPVEPAHEGCLKNDPECTILLETVKKEANCKQQGSKEIVWACGKLAFEIIPVSDEHDWISLKEGEWFCKNCGKFITEDPNPEAPAEPAHEGCLKNDPECTILLETVKQEATCKKEGSKEVVWACGKLVFESIPVADEHNWISLKEGEWFCKDCGKFTAENPNPEAPAEPAHEGCLKNDPECTILLETVKKEATCTQDGSKEIVWACGKLVFEVIPAVGSHAWENGICTVCGEKSPFETAPVEPAHAGCLKNNPDCTILLETVKKEATCTQKGSKEIVWACGKLVLEAIPATGTHTWENGVCTVCGEKSPFETAPVCKHPSGVSVGQKIVSATCEKAGYILTSKVCNTCGETYEITSPLGDAIGHKWRKTITAPTCAKPGKEHYECANCGDFYDVEISAIAHNIVSGKCTGCGLIDCDHPSCTTHEESATCTQNGFRTEVCDICGTVVSNVILGKSGHNLFNGICTDCGTPDFSKITFDFQDIFLLQ